MALRVALITVSTPAPVLPASDGGDVGGARAQRGDEAARGRGACSPAATPGCCCPTLAWLVMSRAVPSERSAVAT